MTPITFFVQGLPKGQPRPRAFAMKFGTKYQARMYDASTAEGWKGSVAMAARPFLPASPLEIPLKVTLMFLMPRPKSHFRANGELKPKAPEWFTQKPDLDNLEKAIEDALTTLGLWRDDSFVVKHVTSKLYARAGGSGCAVTIESADPQPVGDNLL